MLLELSADVSNTWEEEYVRASTKPVKHRKNMVPNNTVYRKPFI